MVLLKPSYQLNPTKRLNRENRETPFGRAKENSHGGRLFADGVPTGFQEPGGSPLAKPAARGWALWSDARWGGR